MATHENNHAPIDETVDGLLFALRGLDMSMEGFRATFASRNRITVNDSLVMTLLSGSPGPQKPSDVARRLNLTAGTLTAMLDRLEAGGFITRSLNPRDRRNLLVELTPNAEAVLNEGRARLRIAIAGAIDPDLRAPMAECLGHLSELLDTVAQQAREAEHDG